MSLRTLTTALGPLVQQTLSKRCLHSSAALCAVDKASIAKLRKKTGFSISKCKEALDKHANDLAQAEAWLHAEAQKHGWAKATKLAGRSTAQGQIGLLTAGSRAAMVELNCETDFVARNDKFKSLLEKITTECLPKEVSQGVTKECLSREQIESLQVSSGETLKDIVALSIGTIGENMVLSRGLKVSAGDDVHLVGCTHPYKPEATFQSGRFGAIVLLKAPTLSDVARQLCMHVIGLNPKAIGKEDDPKAENTDDETLLVHQEWFVDPTKTVAEVLKEANIEVLDFIRYECGESSKSE